MLLRFLAVWAALVLSAAPAFAGDWTVDYGRSRLGFSASAGGVDVAGTFTAWNADITFDPANLAAARVVVIVDMASARTGDAESEDLLPTAPFFDAGRFRRARFVSRRITSLGGNRYSMAGDLTIKGVTRPVTLSFTFSRNGGTAQVIGRLVLDRRLFGVGTGPWAAPRTLATSVTVDVRLSARQ